MNLVLHRIGLLSSALSILLLLVTPVTAASSLSDTIRRIHPDCRDFGIRSCIVDHGKARRVTGRVTGRVSTARFPLKPGLISFII